ncbi:adenylate/guanylate cyclase domain-containing protein [Nannocystis sp.]|uniref:adenylate/guanylate cyclase domain-containing protein n=1 Tax=Nannocystis sp. TaxID=1962667 RepID=UPI0025D80097|nr:adenylate/guanylate cyclase domain-containing protein [Nannocystis sp.]MBK7829406.1 GAF domain-containing protein [Nannocystis sp.]
MGEDWEARLRALERENAVLRERCHQLDVINELAASLLSSQTDLDDILWDVANNAVPRLGLEDCVIYLLDPGGEHLIQRAAFGPKNPRGREILAPIQIRVGQGIVGAVARSGEVVLIPDTRADPRYICDDQPRLSELAVPILHDGRVIGVIDSEHSQAGFFTAVHRELLTIIASMTASRVSRALLDERLREAHGELEARIAERTRALSAERDRSDRLLRNTLPGPIARRLQAGEERIAEHFDAVTVLFADIVGFTRMAAARSPEAIVDLLGRVFTEFDALSDRLGVEKIKTIGDAYMAVAGVPTPRPDHQETIAAMALGILAAVDRVNLELGTRLAVRVGMHSGPVVAGIIGTRKFAYDLWGDTVNTASRMESHGVAGRVHVDHSTFLALQHSHRFEARGSIEVKGLGPMTTYFLLGPR